MHPTLILAVTDYDGRRAADAAGLRNALVATPHTPAPEGRTVASVLLTAAFAMRLADNDERAYEALLRARRDAAKLGAVI